MNLPARLRRISGLLICIMLLLAAPLRGDEKEAAAVGGEVLFNGKDLAGWKLKDPTVTDCWRVVSQVALDDSDSKKLKGTGEGGSPDAALFRQPIAHGTDVYTEESFGDCELHVEFMVPKGSNSGVYLMGQYEVQVFDSFGKPDDKIGPGDGGGIYNTKKPSSNASKAPGEWQSYDIVFRAPRFDASGKKTENATFVHVAYNGKVIHENVEAPKPTGGELPGGEKAEGPLLFQGDHGIVAFRNVRVKPIAIRAEDKK
jgi:hypothetical protein